MPKNGFTLFLANADAWLLKIKISYSFSSCSLRSRSKPIRPSHSSFLLPTFPDPVSALASRLFLSRFKSSQFFLDRLILNSAALRNLSEAEKEIIVIFKKLHANWRMWLATESFSRRTGWSEWRALFYGHSTSLIFDFVFDSSGR